MEAPAAEASADADEAAAPPPQRFLPCQKSLKYLYMPSHKVDSCRGPGGFTTYAHFTVARRDGGEPLEFDWESRAHRKRLHLHLRKDGVLFEEPEPRRRYWCWKPRSLPYWTALTFFLGAVLFQFASLANYTNATASDDDLAQALVGIPSLVGALLFFIGSYIQVLEVINAPPAPEPLQEDPGAPHPPWRWLAWEPARLDFIIAAVQMVGIIVFASATVTGCGVFAWSLKGVRWAVFFPEIVGSCCFVVSTYLSMDEYIHAWWSYKPRDPVWWLNMMLSLGAIGFLLSALAGFAWPGAPKLYYQLTVDAALLFGAICYQVGCYLLVYEQAKGVDPPFDDYSNFGEMVVKDGAVVKASSKAADERAPPAAA